jgi:hypothetical protein
MGSSRTIRLFLSSTFRDFGEGRDLLAKRVFPALGAKRRHSFVDLLDVDTGDQQAEKSEMLEAIICQSTAHKDVANG